ncbi:MAG: MBL fold metallo-hydrolase [Ktedonobacterales bacterium]
MRVISLGSGSSGNAVVIQSGETTVLVDAGFSSHMLARRLHQVGLTPASVQAILLTHEHADHATGAPAFAATYQVPLVSDPRTLKAVLAQLTAPATQQGNATPQIEQVRLCIGEATQVGTLDVRSFPTSHDAVAPCGFLVSSSAWKVCIVTDTGETQQPVIEAMRQAHLVVIEANHDRERLLAGPYPLHLKRRILSATGHLSNQQAGEALASTLDDGPRWIWLAHLSRTNNTPALARAQVRDYLRQRGFGHTHIEVAPPGVGPKWDSSALWD